MVGANHAMVLWHYYRSSGGIPPISQCSGTVKFGAIGRIIGPALVGWCGDLLVYRRIHAGRGDRRAHRPPVVYIKEHINLDDRVASVADLAKESGKDLHPIRSEGDDQYFRDHIFVSRSRFPYLNPFFFNGYLIAIALFWFVPGDFYGQCGRSVG